MAAPKRKRTNEQETRYRARAKAKYERDAKRVLATRLAPPVTHTAIGEALRLMFPWSNAPGRSKRAYPGYTILSLALFEMRVASETIKAWELGNRKAPEWAIELVATRLEREARQRMEIARKLRESANKKATP